MFIIKTFFLMVENQFGPPLQQPNQHAFLPQPIPEAPGYRFNDFPFPGGLAAFRKRYLKEVTLAFVDICKQ